MKTCMVTNVCISSTKMAIDLCAGYSALIQIQTCAPSVLKQKQMPDSSFAPLAARNMRRCDEVVVKYAGPTAMEIGQPFST